MKLLIATRNPDKLTEIRSLFALPGLTLGSALDYPELPETVEDGETLEANATKKAVELAVHTGLWTMADDTGLEVDALGGAPGVYAARYAGEDATYADNVEKLLRELGDGENRAARFRTAVALADPQGNSVWVEGMCPGAILLEARGGDGFGYDPIFRPDDSELTFAEMASEQKNRISHRGRALAAARDSWGGLLGGSPTSLQE